MGSVPRVVGPTDSAVSSCCSATLLLSGRVKMPRLRGNFAATLIPPSPLVYKYHLAVVDSRRVSGGSRVLCLTAVKWFACSFF
jgi:hypothetical protein